MTTEELILFEKLETVANQRSIVYYEDIMPLVGLSWQNPHHRKEIGRMLCTISKDEVTQRRPMLSVLVVQKSNHLPSGSFFDLAQKLGRQGSEDDETFSFRERRLVYKRWFDKTRKSAA